MLIFFSMLENDADREIFNELYNQYGDAMLRVARRYFPNDLHTAEDAVQNAWVRVASKFQNILDVPCKKRGAYLVIIVRNESITILRKRRLELPIDENLADCSDDLGNDYAGDIIDLIRAMPKIYRAVLELRFVEECTSREIALKLGLTESAVNTQIHRGRAMLIQKLREEGYVV